MCSVTRKQNESHLPFQRTSATPPGHASALRARSLDHAVSAGEGANTFLIKQEKNMVSDDLPGEASEPDRPSSHGLRGRGVH